MREVRCEEEMVGIGCDLPELLFVHLVRHADRVDYDAGRLGQIGLGHRVGLF